MSAPQDDQPGCFVGIDHLMTQENVTWQELKQSKCIVDTLNPTVILALPKSPCISFTWIGDCGSDIRICHLIQTNNIAVDFVNNYFGPRSSCYKVTDHLILNSLSQITVSGVKWLQIKVKFAPECQVRINIYPRLSRVHQNLSLFCEIKNLILLLIF